MASRGSSICSHTTEFSAMHSFTQGRARFQLARQPDVGRHVVEAGLAIPRASTAPFQPGAGQGDTML